MTKMIDKVAKAIFDEMDLSDSLALPEAERYARAAIEAMRDPSEWMKEAGAAPIRNYSQGQFPFAQTAGHTFRHMIDAALSGEKAE